MGRRFGAFEVREDLRGFAGRDGWQEGSDVPPPPPADVPPPPPPEPPPINPPSLKGLGTNILLAMAVSLLTSINNALVKQEPKGIVQGQTWAVDSSKVQHVVLSPSCFSVDITNDGPDLAQYRIPDTNIGQWQDLPAGEDITFNFDRPIVAFIGLQVVGAGMTASVRVVGSY